MIHKPNHHFNSILLQINVEGLSKRGCFHPGASTLAPNELEGLNKEIKGWEIIKTMLKYVWPKGDTPTKARVCVAVGLMVGSKVWYNDSTIT